MSIARALSNAVSGLVATSRGTETIAANVANVMTPGYARREVSLSAQVLDGFSGGVRVDGVNRMVNTAIQSEARLSSAACSAGEDIAAFFNRAEDAIGLPGDAAAITTALTRFESTLITASVRPDEDLRLVQVVEAAAMLADRLNAASRTIQDARTAADTSIAHQVGNLQQGLERIAHLNRQIASLSSGGQDVSALHDERQAMVDRIAAIVPLQIIQRDFGRISVFTAEGAALLDGLQPARLSFTAAGILTPDRLVGTTGVSGLVVNGEELAGASLRLFTGGSLGAAFAIRDTHAPQIQAELDALAQDLCRRLADPAVDPTLTSGQPGLFTDAGAAAAPPPVLGLAGTLAVNQAVRPEAGGALWRLRTGLQAAAAGPVGDGSLIDRLSGALKAVQELSPPSPLLGRHDSSGLAASLEAGVASRRLSAEADASLLNTRAANLTERLMAEGVDTDSEMQRLLQYEQAYAANARVIQAIDEMMNTILKV